VLERAQRFFQSANRKFIMYATLMIEHTSLRASQCSLRQGDGFNISKPFVPDHESRDIGQFIDDEERLSDFEDRPYGFGSRNSRGLSQRRKANVLIRNTWKVARWFTTGFYYAMDRPSRAGGRIHQYARRQHSKSLVDFKDNRQTEATPTVAIHHDAEVTGTKTTRHIHG